MIPLLFLKYFESYKYLVIHKMSEILKKKTRMMLQIDDVAVHDATSLICGDAPKQAWRWGMKKQRLILTAGNANII